MTAAEEYAERVRVRDSQPEYMVQRLDAHDRDKDLDRLCVLAAGICRFEANVGTVASVAENILAELKVRVKA